MKSLWARYHKETEGHEVIEEDFGFIRYSLSPPVCLIHDLYVAPEFRGQGKGRELSDRVTALAKEAGVTHLWSQVGDRSLLLTESLSANLHYGFRVQRIEPGVIILMKEIGG